MMARNDTVTLDQWTRIEELAGAVVEGRSDAWKQFWGLIEPELKAWSTQSAMFGRLSGVDDARDAVCLRCMEGLHRDGFRRLRMYFESPRAKKSFRAWMRKVFRNVAIDHIRAHEEYDRRKQSQGDDFDRPRGWRPRVRLSTAGGHGAARPAYTDDTTARELIEFAIERVSAREVDAFNLREAGKDDDEVARALGCTSTAEVRRLVAPMLKVAALELWLEGATFADIAEDLRLDDRNGAERLVAAAKEQMRRRFRSGDPR